MIEPGSALRECLPVAIECEFERVLPPERGEGSLVLQKPSNAFFASLRMTLRAYHATHSSWTRLWLLAYSPVQLKVGNQCQHKQD